MPNLREKEDKIEFAATFRRLIKNKHYVWGVVAQFFYVGTQIAVWSFVIRYAMVQLNLDGVLASLGNEPSVGVIIVTTYGRASCSNLLYYVAYAFCFHAFFVYRDNEVCEGI